MQNIEIFFVCNRICSHSRLYGNFNQYSTVQEHMPPEHQKYAEWNGERFVHWEAKIGCSTEAAAKAIIGSYKVEQQGCSFQYHARILPHCALAF